MKQTIRNILLLTITLLISGLMLAACTASEKSADGKGSAGGTEQAKESNAENKKSEDNSAETKKIAEKQVLYDFRKPDNSKPQTFSNAETDAVVKYLFGETTSKIEIRNRLQGAFTKPNAKETLYYLTGCKDETSTQFTTDCPHVSWDSEGWIAIFDGTTPVLKIEEALGYNVGKITDVNGDGKNEFLSFSGYGQSGIQFGGATLGQISNGKYEKIRGVGGYGDNCGFGAGKSDDELSARASAVSYVPTTDGKMPEFSEEFFKGQCKDAEIDKSSWKETNKKDFDDFIKSIS